MISEEYPEVILIVSMGLMTIFIYVVLGLQNRNKIYEEIKKKHTNILDDLFDIEMLRNILIDINHSLKIGLALKEFIPIGIDGHYIPLVKGSCAFVYVWGRGGLTAPREEAFFMIGRSNDECQVLRNHKNIFKLAYQHKEVSIFWIKDFKKLYCFLDKTTNP